MRQAITPAELLNQWLFMRVSILNKLKTATGMDKDVLEVMDFTLSKCIEDLDAVLNQDYPAGDFLAMLSNLNDS